jgi:hypothetical protein
VTGVKVEKHDEKWRGGAEDRKRFERWSEAMNGIDREKAPAVARLWRGKPTVAKGIFVAFGRGYAVIRGFSRCRRTELRRGNDGPRKGRKIAKSLRIGETSEDTQQMAAGLFCGSSYTGERSMTIQVAVLCDAATDYNGKLNLLGTFDTIYAPQMPMQHSQCSIAVRIAFDRIEEGTHTLHVNFVDEDGLPIMKAMQIPVAVEFPADATFISRNLVVNIIQLTFSKTGLYSVDLSLNDRPLSSIPLAVKQLEEKPI